MRAKLEGLCVRYMRENPAVNCSDLLTRALKKLKAAATKNSLSRLRAARGASAAGAGAAFQAPFRQALRQH